MSAAGRTRDAILDGFLQLAHRENAINISVPAVAEEAGVSIRTVYRYFPTKDDLQTAAAYRMSERVLRSTTLDDVGIENIGTYLDELWTGFDQSMPAVIAEHTTPAGRNLRRTRLPIARKVVRAGLAEEIGPAGNSAERRELVDLLVAVTSSSMFLELVDRMGHKPDRAAAMATHLVHIISDHAAGNSARTSEGDHP